MAVAAAVCHTRTFPPQVNQSQLDPAVSGSLLALPLTKTTIGVWDLTDPRHEAVSFIGHKRSVSSLCFSHDEPRLLCSAGEDYLILWNVRKCLHNAAQGKEVRGEVILSHPGDVSHACFSMDAAQVAVCTDSVVKVISVLMGKVTAELVGHAAKVTAAGFCPHYSATLVTISDDRSVIVWDVKNLSLLYQSTVLSSAPLISLAMNKAEPHVAVASANGTIKVFDLADGKDFRQLCQLDVGKMLSKFRQTHQQKRNSVPSDGPVVVTKGGASRKPEGPEAGDASFNSIECGDAVLSLLYVCPRTNDRPSQPPPQARDALLDTAAHGAVGQVLSAESPLLVIVSSQCMIQVDSKTLDVLSVVDFQQSMPSVYQPAVREITISGTGLAGMGQLCDGQLGIVVGTLFESRAHSLQWEVASSKSVVGRKISLHASVEKLTLSPSTTTEDGESAESLEELNMVANRPLADNSPLKSEITHQNTSGATANGKRGSIGGKGKKPDPMNQPLTFKSKVKSSGYTQAPRTTMFQPKTNSRSRSVDSSRNQNMKSQSLAAKISSQEYPPNAGPPSELTCKLNTGSAPASVTDLKFSGTGQHLAVCMTNKTSLVFPTPFGQKDSTVFVGHDSSINSINWSNNSKHLLTASNDKTAILWDRLSGDALLTFSSLQNNTREKQTSDKSKADSCYTKEVKGAQFYYMDKFVLIVVGNQLCLYKYHLDPTKDDIKRYLTKSKYKLVKSWQTVSQNFTTLAAANAFYSHLAVCAGSNRDLEVYDLNVGQLTHTFCDSHAKPAHAIALNEGSTFTSQPQEAFNVFATSAVLDCIKLWDLRSQRCVLRLQGHTNQAHGCGIAFSACGTYLASGSEDKLAYVYDVRQGTFCQKLRGHSDVVSSVAFHPARPVLATGAIDGKMLLFQA